jgi:uncharacterized protein YacL (UPF0231 family)
MDEWFKQEIQRRATKLAQANAKSTKEYEAEWVADGHALSKWGGDGYCLKTGTLAAEIADLLRILETAELYVPEPQAEPEEA